MSLLPAGNVFIERMAHMAASSAFVMLRYCFLPPVPDFHLMLSVRSGGGIYSVLIGSNIVAASLFIDVVLARTILNQGTIQPQSYRKRRSMVAEKSHDFWVLTALFAAPLRPDTTKALLTNTFM